MDIKEYSKLIKAKRKELDGLMKRKMPVIAGRMAKDHFQDNFRREGFVNGGLHPWPKAKRLSSGAASLLCGSFFMPGHDTGRCSPEGTISSAPSNTCRENTE